MHSSSCGSGEGEREERRCLLVARLKVCSVTERGAGGGRTSSRWSPRGMGGGGVNKRVIGEDWQLSRVCLTRYFSVLVERRVVGEMAIFANPHKLRRPLLSTPSTHPLLSDLPDLSVIRP